MRMDPLNVSPWLAGIVTGIVFGVAFGVVAGIANPGQWTEMAVAGVVAGVVLAVTIRFSVRNGQRRLAPAVEGLSPDEAKSAYRASRRGPVPVEPEIRAAALGIAARQLAGILRVRVWLLVAGGCVVLSQILIALDDDSREWWRFWPAAGMVLVIAAQFYQPRQLRRRIALLSGPTDGVDAAEPRG